MNKSASLFMFKQAAAKVNEYCLRVDMADYGTLTDVMGNRTILGCNMDLVCIAAR